MARDLVVEEVRAIREAWSREYNYDLKAIVAALQQEQAKSGQPVVTLSPKGSPTQAPVRKAS